MAMITIRRALLSCYDKTGLDVFAKGLAELGIELIASGGTAEALTRQGLRPQTVERFAGIAKSLDGRVKTLHPKIHGGILARRDDPAHLAAVGGPEGLIDLVVVNLYPFAETVSRPGCAITEAIEQIDIGGVALLRAAAKNFAHTAVLCAPGQYLEVLAALRQGRGTVPEALTRRLAAAAFAVTGAYDTAITGYLAGPAGSVPQPHGETAAGAIGPLRQHQVLRYGENPHQRGAWYLPEGGSPWGLGTLRQRQGKALSYNNLLDMDAAVRCLADLPNPACVIIKHNSQCGLAAAATPAEAYRLAYACDAESAFGGIVGFNRPLDEAAAHRLAETFLEVVVAPAVEPDALAVLGKKPNLRVVTLTWPAGPATGAEWRQLLGGWAQQDADAVVVDLAQLDVVTRRQPTDHERADLLFAWVSAKHAKSNAVVLARQHATVGIGQGQPSRVGSVRLALEKAGEAARGAVAASDGFFPFPDGVELLGRAGVTAVIQPGGSLRDAAVVEAADQAGLAMVVTHLRHFRH